ncbi:MAG: rRNA ((967)-C(5))-methyltransferase, partial [Cellvibrio sp.]|nr:rRNA ((967)-C(5))-methyltransferase [Cellvibrio sp.]
MLSVRAAAAQVITQILTAKGSLSSLLPPISAKIADNDRALL